MRVTVYVPTHNRRALVRRAAESVLAQDYVNLQLIIVDDGSVDGTFEYLKDLEESDSRVLVLRNDVPVGAPKSRNRAILRADGEFVTGLDDDDYFAPSRIGSFVASWADFIKRDIVPAALYSSAIHVTEQGDKLVARPEVLSFRDLFAQNTLGNQIFAPRKHFIEAGLFDESLPAWQDLDLFIRVLRKFGNAYLVDQPSYIFDDDLERDRISTKTRKVRVAMEMIRAKYHELDRSLSVDLCLQMYNGYYKLRPTWRDIRYVLKHGPSFRSLGRLARRCLQP